MRSRSLLCAVVLVEVDGRRGSHFPEDLVQTQHACNAADRALAEPRSCDATALRRRLLRLSARLWWHPYWRTVPSVPTACTQLRELARAREESRAA
ncbi:hypothetical protein ABZ614_07085 [Streptomyces sp. NPDC013178]|uniref:hypothetical protein n=1 Tax=Streptomyces sp. NPDC013178 TaxID=3155118 RepID=UPI0033DC874B